MKEPQARIALAARLRGGACALQAHCRLRPGGARRRRSRAWAVALALALCLAAGARAEEHFTRREEICYHACENCLGQSGRVPISVEAAQLFGKLPCSICAQPASGESPRAAIRGGTAVLRLSDGQLAQADLSVGNIAAQRWTGEAAQRALASLLHGRDYAAFMAELASDGRASGRALLPEALPAQGEMLMSARHVGAHWYFAVRLSARAEGAWEARWRVNGCGLSMEGGALRAELGERSQAASLVLEPEAADEAEAQLAFDGLCVELYRSLGAHIAVIYSEAGGAGAELRIGGDEAGARLRGYEDGGEWVYCCALTEAEAARLLGGEAARLLPIEIEEPLDLGLDGATDLSGAE